MLGSVHYYVAILIISMIGFKSNAYSQQAIEFADPNLQAAIREALSKPTGDITEADMLTLESLIAENRNITDLSGLESATNLKLLSLVSNSVSDLSPLEPLSELFALVLINNSLDDLSTLPNLPSLQYLYLDDNNLTDISGLVNCPELTILYIANNQISDLTPLSSLPHLSTLHAGRNFIADIQALSNLSSLTTLRIDLNQVSDLGPLSNLVTLETLSANYNRIQDISPLANLENLKDIQLSFNQINDLTPIIGVASQLTIFLIQYNHLDLRPNSEDWEDLALFFDITQTGNHGDYLPQHWLDSPIIEIYDEGLLDAIRVAAGKGNPIGEVPPFENAHRTITQYDLETITSLDVDGINNRVNNITPLQYAINLNGVRLIGDFTNLTPLSNLAGLKFAYLRGMFSDLTPLQNLTNLESLSIVSSNIVNIASLATLERLDHLSIQGEFSDIDGLANLPNLTQMSVYGDYLTDLSAIPTLPKLEYLHLHGNALHDLSPLGASPSLRLIWINNEKPIDLEAFTSIGTLAYLVVYGPIDWDLDSGNFSHYETLSQSVLLELTKPDTYQIAISSNTNGSLEFRFGPLFESDLYVIQTTSDLSDPESWQKLTPAELRDGPRAGEKTIDLPSPSIGQPIFVRIKK